MRRRGAKSFVDDLGLSRGVVLSRAVRFCDLLRLSPMTRRFVRFRRTRLLARFPRFRCRLTTAIRDSEIVFFRHIRDDGRSRAFFDEL